jgi:polyhydroxyalkanoate synthase subunit PhaC
MTDTNAFRLGENVATPPGKVIAQNNLMQLIEYAPATSEAKKRRC